MSESSIAKCAACACAGVQFIRQNADTMPYIVSRAPDYILYLDHALDNNRMKSLTQRSSHSCCNAQLSTPTKQLEASIICAPDNSIDGINTKAANHNQSCMT